MLAGHRVHSFAPPAAKDRESQGMHSSRFAAGEYVPAGHGRHRPPPSSVAGPVAFAGAGGGVSTNQPAGQGPQVPLARSRPSSHRSSSPGSA